MEDIGVLLTIESMIKEIYDKLKQLEYDDKLGSIKHSSLIAELKAKLDWEDLVLQRIITSSKIAEVINNIQKTAADDLIENRLINKIMLNIKNNKSPNYNMNMTMGIHIDSASLALAMIDKYLQSHPKSPVIKLKYDIIFTSPSVIENEIVASNFRIPTNPTMITDNFRAIYKLPWELHDSAKEQEIELEFIIHLKELVNHILSNTDQVTLFYDQVMLRSLITLSGNEQLTKMLQGFIDNENLTFNKDPFREVLKYKEEDKQIPTYITLGFGRRN